MERVAWNSPHRASYKLTKLLKSISEGCRKESWQTCEEALSEKVRGKQPADRPDRRLKDGDVDVNVKAHLGSASVSDTLNLRNVVFLEMIGFCTENEAPVDGRVRLCALREADGCVR